MDQKIWLIIAGMALVTALIRMLPFQVLSKGTLSPMLKEWLRLLPVVIFASMIAPPLLLKNGALAPLANAPDLITVTVAGAIAYFTRNLALSLITALLVLMVTRFI